MATENTIMAISYLDWIALGIFIVCWYGYTTFARKRARTTHSLSSILRQLRIDWMATLTRKDHQIADAALLGNVERTVTFFASSTILVLAGVLTVLASAEKLMVVLQSIPFTAVTSTEKVQVKLFLLALIFVFAFFKFTWAIRQFGFVSVLMGVAPQYRSPDYTEEQRDMYVRHSAKVLDQAGHEYNNGLRAYYFALAFLMWFIHPFFFIGTTLLVVWVLYRREYRSRILRSLLATKGLVPGKQQQE
ncbi:Uncharacterized membrane protein [Pseudidiomarina planktonica]|uniref:Uncharacterized membrane protein n=1 Tax=Pseudidiomarina planktonica TaxID=1323738 RepID=A0A1Y6EVM5_9GAMM|nr:DUF599 domain-containing protein [Pseudidiomarina planktonica]SMQ66607.1 Uncharacterized membrane protein [Pseudidiomarina planktonica]